MDFEFSAEQEQLRAAVRRYLADHAPLAWVRAQQSNERGTTDEVWRGLCDFGVHLGPGGGSLVDIGVVLEELGRALYPGPFVSSAVGAASIEPLDGLLSGELVGTLALYEPDARYEWRTPTTTATANGRLSGVKSWVPDGAAADVVYVVASEPDGLAVFAVDTDSEGVTVEPAPTVDVTRRWTTLRLEAVPGRRLALGADTEHVIGAVLDRLAVAWVVDAVGAAEHALGLAVEYAKERVQFGKPIGSFQAVQHLCAQMLQTLELARAGAYYALWALDAAPAPEAHRTATMAKAFASDGLPRLGADCIQVFGGIGFTWEHDAHLYFKRLLSLEHVLGGAAEHLEALARIVV
jgi:alkylation response protein AidB-like acyl-CoA dehydrogenase